MSIQLENVEFYYPNSSQKRVLDITQLSLEKSKKHFLYGPSGSGKSTLLNLISGIYSPTAGSISVLGKKMETMKRQHRDRFRANNIGYIFQQFNLISYLNAIENIKLASDFSAKPKAINFTQQIHNLLENLGICANDRSRPVSTLSFGQQQRVAIARAFINEPKLLIADEPTSSLDENSRDNFISLLNSQCEQSQATLLFVSHDTRLAKYFDSVQELTSINNCLNNENGSRLC